MIKGRRRSLPTLTGERVEFVGTEKLKLGGYRVTVSINGWPFDLRVDAQDELGAMQKVYAMQRGEKPTGVFNMSK